MKVLKFKELFCKLPIGIDGEKVILVNISRIKLNELHNELIKYDTRSLGINENIKYFKLDKSYSDYMLLLFLFENELFTSLRKATFENLEYYKVNEKYIVEIEK